MDKLTDKKTWIGSGMGLIQMNWTDHEGKKQAAFVPKEVLMEGAWRVAVRAGLAVEPDLSRAIAIAAVAHAGQIDRSGQPYILHPLRVMMRCKTMPEMIVGALHDVVEDCPAWTLDRLEAEGFGGEIVEALDTLTRRKDESYAAFIERVAAGSELARTVKIHDLLDNCALGRMANPTDEDRKRVTDRYLPALQRLIPLLDDKLILGNVIKVMSGNEHQI